MKRVATILLLLILAGNTCLHAHEPDNPQGFIPNKGQWHPQVRYKMSLPQGAMFLEPAGFSYTLYDASVWASKHEYSETGKEAPSQIRSHTLRMRLEGASEVSSTREESPSLTRYNFFIGNDSRKWASGLHSYQSVTYPEVYPGTDLKLYIQEKQFKYDFILQPGADIAAIRMHYDGAEQISVKDGQLVLKTSLGEIIEQAPVAWQVHEGQKIPLNCRFRIFENGSIGFEAPDANPEWELVIDPQVIFATYTGSLDDNWGFTATNDNAGNGYVAGVVFGTRFHTTAGAVQEDFGGGVVDIGIVKFDPLGTQALYITYLGGMRSDFPHSIIVNEYNELIVFGSTGSADFPVTSGAYSNTFKGGTSTGFSIMSMPSGSDIFICRISADGTILLASTLVGGTQNDGLNVGGGNELVRNYADQIRGALWVDADNNVYVGTSTLSSDFPGTTGRFQATYGGGGQDGIVLKMNGNLSKLLWATYLGGSASDGIFYLTVDNDQNVVVTGGTKSENFPVSAQAWQKNFAGGAEPDGFAAKLDSSGTQLIASTYIGTPAYDQSYITGTDITDHIYLFGQTRATANEFVVNSPIGVTGGNQFIMKLDPMLSQVVWSTTYGRATGRPDISPSALLVDVCDKIYASGWGGTLNGPFGAYITGMYTTADAIKANTDGSDFYFYVISSDATSIEFASYYGGNFSSDHVDGGTSRFDRKGVIYQAICAGCGGVSDLPATPNAYSPTNRASNCNNALIKVDFESPIVISAFVLSDANGQSLSVPVGCAPFQVNFENTSINASEFKWLIDGTEISSDQDLSHLFSSSGNYEITLISTSSSTCNFSDTSSMSLTVLADIQAELTDIRACRGSEVSLGPDGFDDPYYGFSWSPAEGLDNPSGRRPKLTVGTDTTFQLIISMGGCADTLVQNIHIEGSRTVLDQIGICAQDTVQIGPSGTPPDSSSFSWSPSEGLSNPNLYNPLASPASSTNYILLLTRPGQVCPDTLTQRIEVGTGTKSSLPDANACHGDSVRLGPAQPLPNIISCSWSPVTGLGNPSVQNPNVLTATNREYRLILEKSGCNDTLIQQVKVVGRLLPQMAVREACLNDSVLIGYEQPLPDSGIVYEWIPSSVYSNSSAYNPKVLFSQNMDYTLVVHWPLPACADTLEAKVNQIIESFQAGPDVEACKGIPAGIGIPDASGLYSYSWSPPSLVSNPSEPATEVKVSDNTWLWLTRTPKPGTPGCLALDSVFVSLTESPVAGFGIKTIPACDGLGIQFTDSSEHAQSLIWEFGKGITSSETNPLIHLGYGDSLQALQIAINGVCRDSASLGQKLKTIDAYYKEQDVNVFSPNDDGINDCFSLALQPGSGSPDETFVACSELLVFNRWGEKVFDSAEEGKPACWDGRNAGGEPLPEGVYFFRYTFKKGAPRTGNIHLRRN